MTVMEDKVKLDYHVIALAQIKKFDIIVCYDLKSFTPQ